MESVTIAKARQNLYKLVTNTNQNYQPIQILSKNGNAVLISADDWKAIQETLYLASIPGMNDTIIKGLREPLNQCKSADEVDW